MTNVFKARAGADPMMGIRRTEDELRAWCWESNQRAMERKFSRWLSVNRDKDSGALACVSRAGADALDVIKVLSGWRPDFINWDKERLDSEFRLLRHIARMGMPEGEWEARFASKLIGV